MSDEAIAWDRSIRERVFAILKAETGTTPNIAAREKLLDELGSAKPVAPGAPDGAAARQLANALFKGSQPSPVLSHVRSSTDAREAALTISPAVLKLVSDWIAKRVS